MIEDVYEPLAKFRDEFKEKFARLTREKFQALTATSGVDVAANRKLVAEIYQLEARAVSVKRRKFWAGFFATLVLLAGGALLAGGFLLKSFSSADRGVLVAIAAAVIPLGILLVRVYRRQAAMLKELLQVIAQKKSEAEEQMAPLNRLYTWDIPVKLIEATVPRLAFDPYFTERRLASLRSQYGWDDRFNENKSILFSQSGVINGNPFVIGHYVEQEWGEKVYEGTRDISWRETYRDEKGRIQVVTRYQTLHAEVTKPIPVYPEHKVLIYGNDAAPNLNFSRKPSGLTGEASGFFEKRKKNSRLKELEAYSHNLSDDSNFTLMGNHDFEAWFFAKNRDNEVEFRMLFSPIAQIQMLKLMQDEKVGYGDDFTFFKQGKINALFSEHLNKSIIDTDPGRFRYWDYDAAAKFFQSFNEQYFKNIYFSFAPLLAIPLYQQMQSEEQIWKDVWGVRDTSFWEHEAVANYYGENQFRHAESITRNILKTSVSERTSTACTIAVTAQGFRGEKRVDHVWVNGGNGNRYQVPVEWIEYLPVERTTDLHLSDQPSNQFTEWLFRRQLYSSLA